MKSLLPKLRGLSFKLAVFYLFLSIPILILVEATVLYVEYYHLMREVKEGALSEALDYGTGEIREGLSPRQFLEAPWVAWLESWLIRIQLPREVFSDDAAYILTELSREPLAAAFYAGDGDLIAQAPPYRERELNLPSAEQLEQARQSATPIQLPGTDDPLHIRRVLGTVTDENRQFVGWLYLEMRVPQPWHKILGDISVEWFIVLVFMIVFALASSAFLTTYVTRRLRRISAAAKAWSQGDFSQSTGDDSTDELGQLSRSLDQMAAQLRALMHSRTQLATLRERQRLARDLHDTVKQKAFVLNLQLAAINQKLKDAPLHGELQAAQQLCNQIQGELATLLDELRGDDRSLVQRLQDQIHEWRDYSGIATRLHCDEFPVVEVSTADQLLRICDEALSNILRHSDATQVRIHLHHHAGKIMLSISDNGHGRIPSTHDGMGLRNIRERASQLPGGRCRVEGVPDHGTRIEVECDIRAENE